MERRRTPGDGEDFTSQLGPLVEDDQFLTELSKGIDPSDGSDDVAGLLLELRADVERQLPPAPVVEGADEQQAAVIPMGRARKPRPWLHGLVGAAAATVLIAGSGAVLAGTGLLGGGGGQDPTVVELAGTLEELDSRAAEGDMTGTRELLAEARRLVDSLDSEGRATQAERGAGTGQERVTNTRQAPPETLMETATVTETVSPAEASDGESPEPTTVTAPAETVTESTTVTQTSGSTSTQRVTVTETIVRENPLNPTTNPSEPTEPGDGGGGGLAPPQGQQ